MWPQHPFLRYLVYQVLKAYSIQFGDAWSFRGLQFNILQSLSETPHQTWLCSEPFYIYFDLDTSSTSNFSPICNLRKYFGQEMDDFPSYKFLLFPCIQSFSDSLYKFSKMIILTFVHQRLDSTQLFFLFREFSSHRYWDKFSLMFLQNIEEVSCIQ